jgi:hypothetical protein
MSEMPDRCPDCAAILSELREAFEDAIASADRATKEAWANTYRMIGIGGSEEATARMEESFPHVHAAELLEMKPNRIGRAMLAASMHVALTGHKLPLRLPTISPDSES